MPSCMEKRNKSGGWGRSFQSSRTPNTEASLSFDWHGKLRRTFPMSSSLSLSLLFPSFPVLLYVCTCVWGGACVCVLYVHVWPHMFRDHMKTLITLRHPLASYSLDTQHLRRAAYKPQKPSCSWPYSSGVQARTYGHAEHFNMGTGDLDSGHDACIAGILATELFTGPSLLCLGAKFSQPICERAFLLQRIWDVCGSFTPLSNTYFISWYPFALWRNYYTSCVVLI